MEIIDELEPLARGPYTGCHGYLGFNRESQLSISIRTALRKDDAVPQATVDTARSANAAAQAALAQAKANLQMQTEMKTTAQTRVNESAARVEQSYGGDSPA